MTRFVIDAGAVLELVAREVDVGAGHELLAPTLIRSQVLSTLHEAVARGELTEQDAKRRRAAVDGLSIRLLGDGVLRRRAWDIATRLGWASTFDAEYLSLTQLQADAFITLDEDLARRAAGEVRIAALDDLR